MDLCFAFVTCLIFCRTMIKDSIVLVCSIDVIVKWMYFACSIVLWLMRLNTKYEFELSIWNFFRRDKIWWRPVPSSALEVNNCMKINQRMGSLILKVRLYKSIESKNISKKQLLFRQNTSICIVTALWWSMQRGPFIIFVRKTVFSYSINKMNEQSVFEK